MFPKPVVILGSQAVGLSLALACARAGIEVSLIEPDADARERTKVFAFRDDPDAAKDIVLTDQIARLNPAGLIFDALGDDPRTPYTAQISNEAVVITAGSAALWARLSKPTQLARFVSFQPMQLRALTEIAPFPRTRDDVLDQIEAFAQAIGRIPVRLPSGGVSVGLRLVDRLEDVACQLLLEGAVPWELDEIMTAFGFDLGFFEAQDLTGLDVAYARRKARGHPNLIADRAVEEGRIGKKIGWGWYRYPGGGGAVIDPLIEDLIREEAWFAKVDQLSISDDVLHARLMLALIDEATRILTEGQVLQPTDLNLISVEGLGFPREIGGVLSYADQLGASMVVDQLLALGQDPAPALLHAARTGTRLVDYRGSAGE